MLGFPLDTDAESAAASPTADEQSESLTIVSIVAASFAEPVIICTTMAKMPTTTTPPRTAPTKGIDCLRWFLLGDAIKALVDSSADGVCVPC